MLPPIAVGDTATQRLGARLLNTSSADDDGAAAAHKRRNQQAMSTT
jgi:hypothetical protein